MLIPCLQLASLLLEKLHLFTIYFRKEGVVHQIEVLKENPPISLTPPLPAANQNPPSQSLPSSLPPPVFHSMQLANQGSPPSMPPGINRLTTIMGYGIIIYTMGHGIKTCTMG